MLVEVTAIDQLKEGIPTAIRVRNRELLLTRWKGRVYALRNICPHQTQSFVNGTVRDGVVSSRVGDLDFDEAEPVLSCPFHHFDFSLISGGCQVDSTLRVRTYSVAIQNGRVLVDIDRIATSSDSPA